MEDNKFNVHEDILCADKFDQKQGKMCNTIDELKGLERLSNAKSNDILCIENLSDDCNKVCHSAFEFCEVDGGGLDIKAEYASDHDLEQPLNVEMKSLCVKSTLLPSAYSIDTSTILYKDRTNTNYETNPLELDIKCEVEDTKISYVAIKEEFSFVSTSLPFVTKNKRSGQRYCKRLDGAKTSTVGKNVSASEDVETRPNVCTNCSKNFTSKRNLRRHLKSHHLNLAPYSCSNCKKNFTRKENLTYHQMSSHLKAKPHKCPICEKTFAKKQSLDYHRVCEHLKIKRYHCTNCDKSFTHKQSLNSHRLAQHLKTMPYQCDSCERSYSAKRYLKRHQKAQHSELKPFICPNCNMGYTTKYNLERHLKSRHSRGKI